MVYDHEGIPLNTAGSGLDLQPLNVDHELWTRLRLAYDPDDQYDWPRQRSHFVESVPVGGWRLVAEFHSFDGYDPAKDFIETADLVHVGIEPETEFPWHIQRTLRSLHDEPVLNPDDAAEMTEDGLVEVYPLAHSRVGLKPDSGPPTELVKLMTQRNLKVAGEIVVEGSVVASESQRLRGWYQLPRPLTSPAKRGRGARNVRIFAELAALYLHAAEVAPDAPVKWLHETFDYTGWPITRWNAVGNDLAKYGFITDRRHGAGGGTITQRSLDEIQAHRR